jgi:hypothetical protein
MRAEQRGIAVLTTLVLVIALVGGGAVLVGLQISSSRSMGIVRDSMTALNCAEAGLVAARPFVAANVAGWNTASLCNPPPPRGTGGCSIGTPLSEPAWLAPMPHDVDGDSTNDVVITLVDNDDEIPSDPTVDVDQSIHIIATCNIHGARAQVDELVHYDAVTVRLTRKLWLRTE